MVDIPKSVLYDTSWTMSTLEVYRNTVMHFWRLPPADVFLIFTSQAFFIRRKIIMNASVAIQVLPTVTDENEVIRIVDEVIDYIKSTGLNYYVGPCETSIEGDYDELMEIVKNCQLVAAKAGCPAMNTYVKISFKPEGDVLTIDKKVTKHHQ